MKANQRILVGVIIAPFGIKGDVKIKSFTDPIENLVKYKTLQTEGGNPIKLKLIRSTNGVLYCKIHNMEISRDDAEALKKTELYILREELPSEDEDEFYITDLIGIEIFDKESGQHLGVISEVNNFGAGDIIEFKTITGKAELHPFTKEIFFDIDIIKKQAYFKKPTII